jgi:hypothetical protein
VIPAHPLALEAAAEMATRYVDEQLLEGLVVDVEPGLGGDELAERLGYAVAEQQLHPGVFALRLGVLVLVAPMRDRTLRRVVIAHEIAHGELRAMNLHHAHGDVWALTLAMLMPVASVRAHGSGVALAAACSVPLWAALLREKMPTICDVSKENEAHPIRAY